MKFSRSIAFRLLASMVPISLLGILLIGTCTYYITRHYVIQTVKRDVHSLGVEAAQSISNYFAQRKNDLNTISEIPLFTSYHNNVEFSLMPEAEMYRQELEKYMADFSGRTETYNSIIYLTDKGKTVCYIKDSHMQPTRAAFPDPVLLEKLLATSTKSPRIFFPSAAMNGQAPIYLSKLLFNDRQKKCGILVLGCKQEPIAKILNRLGAVSSRFAYLVDEHKMPLSLSSSLPRVFGRESGEVFSDFCPIEGTPWLVAITVSLNNLLDPLYRIRFISAALILLCGSLVVFLIYIRIRSLIQPIETLMKATQRLTAGDLSGRATVGDDEIGTLAKSFNTMAETLQMRAAENENLLKSIRLSETRYRTTVNNSLDGIIGLDNTFKIVTWNWGAEILFGYDQAEIHGRPFSTLFEHSTIVDLLKQIQLCGFVRNHDARGLRKNGDKLLLSITMAGAHDESSQKQWWSLVIRDVTEQKALQAQLIQAEKLSAVGQLISGVAHEINNPLTAVVGYAELLAMEEGLQSPQIKTDLECIYQNAIRCREIVANLLRFVRKDQMQRKMISVNEVVHEVIKLMEYRVTRKESIQLELNLDPSNPKILGDFQQLEQVFVNLLQNACDALGETQHSKKITTRTAETAIYIEVADNGPGMPKELCEKIFEPFFTTKEEGKGTGLGLAISRRIILEHMGNLFVKSERGAGATFVIELPKSQQALPQSNPSEQQLPPAPGRTILLVDDEKDLVALMRQILKEEGCVTDVATSGQEALKQMKAKKYDLVISDVELGDMKANSIVSMVAHENRPGGFLFVSGDMLNTSLVESLKKLKMPYISKPFSVADFRQIVRATLLNLPSEFHGKEGPKA